MQSGKPTSKNTRASSGQITIWGALACLIVCATVAFIAHLLVQSSPPPSRRLWMPVVVQTNGDLTVLGETRQLEFWTPSARTKDYLHKEGEELGSAEKWMSLANEDPVTQFGSVLHSNQNVLGYRRIEVWGQGRTNFKPGWWWTVNVFSNSSVADLGRAYQNFWHSPQPVFIEVIDNRGSDEK